MSSDFIGTFIAGTYLQLKEIDLNLKETMLTLIATTSSLEDHMWKNRQQPKFCVAVVINIHILHLSNRSGKLVRWMVSDWTVSNKITGTLPKLPIRLHKIQ